jgi:uncharacterized membrane protein
MPGWSTRDLLLAGSIAVNLVLAGIVIGAGARLIRPDAAGPAPSVVAAELTPGALYRSLSPQNRRAVRRMVVGEGLRSAPLFGELRDAVRDFETIARAEPFDADRARDALDRIWEVEGRLRERSTELIVEILAELPAEDRARMVAEMRDSRRLRTRGERAP